MKVLKMNAKMGCLLKMVLDQCCVCVFKTFALITPLSSFPLLTMGTGTRGGFAYRDKSLPCLVAPVRMVIRKWIHRIGCLRQASLRFYLQRVHYVAGYRTARYNFEKDLRELEMATEF